MIFITQNHSNIVPRLCLLGCFFLLVSMSLPAHAARMGGMGKMRGGESMMMKSPEERAAEIAEKLSLSEIQQVEVVYLLENMFRQQSEYMEKIQDSNQLSRNDAMVQMKAVREKTIEQVGDFLNDDQLAQLTELLNSSMNRQAGGRPSGGGGGGRSIRSY